MVVLASFYNNSFIAGLSEKKNTWLGRSDIKHEIYIDYLMNGQETIPDTNYSLIMWNPEGIIHPVQSVLEHYHGLLDILITEI